MHILSDKESQNPNLIFYYVFTAEINHPDNDIKVDNRGFYATINNLKEMYGHYYCNSNSSKNELFK